MKKFVLLMFIVVSAVSFSQNAEAQVSQSVNTEIDMISMDNFYSLDIVEVDPSMQEAIYNAYDNCLIKEVYKSNGNSSPVQYKVNLVTKEEARLIVAFDERGSVIKTISEDEYTAAQKK